MEKAAISYPFAERSSTVEALHGVEVADPYRWLEDIDSPKAAAWASAQSELTEKMLAGVGSRDLFAERLSQLWALPAVGVPFQRGGRWFQTRSSGLAAQPDLLYVMDKPGYEGRVLLDPASMSADGTAAGHGHGKPTGQAIAEVGDCLAFIDASLPC